MIDDYDSLSVVPIEVKSGKDYSVHRALNNLVSIDEFNIQTAFIVSNNREVYQKNKSIYIPVYFCMFL